MGTSEEESVLNAEATIEAEADADTDTDTVSTISVDTVGKCRSISRTLVRRFPCCRYSISRHRCRCRITFTICIGLTTIFPYVVPTGGYLRIISRQWSSGHSGTSRRALVHLLVYREAFLRLCHSQRISMFLTFSDAVICRAGNFSCDASLIPIRLHLAPLTLSVIRSKLLLY